MPFLGAHPSLLRALIERGISEPTAVQRAILECDPAADLMVSAQTGSGKTVAFGLSIAPTILGDAARFPTVPRERGKALGPLALVVTPTRELAMQVAAELSWLYAQAGGAVATCVGGMDIGREHKALARGPHFVVGTPGRLCDHLDRGALVLDRIQVVVLDEADEMLDMGFRDELERILKAIPTEPAHRTLLFSATIPPGIAALAKRYTRGAIRIATADEKQPHADIEQRAIAIRPIDRIAATVNVLRFHEARAALVFCATRDGVQDLARELAARGFSVVALSGELSQRERTAALTQVRAARARVLVATDVAARGLDLPELELVVHADLPHNRDMMIHRSGRTGRAGRKGTSVLLVPLPRRGFVERVLASKASPITWTPAPTEAEIVERDLVRLDADIARDVAEIGDRDRELGRSLAARVPAEDLAALIVRGRLSAAPTPAPIQTIRERGESRPRPHDVGPDPGPNPNGDYVVFRVNIGRRGNADPKWLIPVLCRRGDIDRRSIGKIRILERETHVEIARSHADAFATAVARPDTRDRKIVITALPAA
jgi:ATP-dependent RNA helicase DeaD